MINNYVHISEILSCVRELGNQVRIFQQSEMLKDERDFKVKKGI